MRLCECERYVPGEAWSHGRDCVLCWLYHNREDYKEAFDENTIELSRSTTPPNPLTGAKKSTLAQRLARFAKAIKYEMTWRSKGGQAPTTDEKAKRRAFCDSCDQRDDSNDNCKLCGCYLEAGLLPPRPLGKLDCATQACPLKKWGTTGGAIEANCRGVASKS